jgi:hypothetical protein
MSLLSSNLLNAAARLIPLQPIVWTAWSGTTAPNDIGVLVPAYSAPVTLNASVQPVPRTLYEDLGLDFQKNYRMIYCSQSFQDLERASTPDFIDYGGRRYNVLSNTDWQSANGWQGSVCIDVGPTPS